MPGSSVDPRLLETARSVEWRTRRILGGMRFEDRTTRELVSNQLRVRIPGVNLFWNRSGHLILSQAPGLESYTRGFRSVPHLSSEDSLSFVGTVEDLTGRYLSRSFSFRLPRDPDPTRHESSDSLFQAVSVALFPSPIASASHPLWSQVRVSLARSLHGAIEPLSEAFVRITDASGTSVLGSGLTDSRGEGVIFIPGVPLARSAEGAHEDEEEPVVVYDLPARIQVVWKPLEEKPPDPDHLEEERAVLVRSDEPLFLKAGRTERIRRTLTIA